MARVRNPLYVMAKPPADVAARIAALPRNDSGRAPELLHVTLTTLFDLASAPPDWLPKVIAAFDAFEGKPFPLSFDRIEMRKCVTLRSRALLPEARAFQAAMIHFLIERQVPIMLGTTPEPHITINYHGDRLGGQKVDPIGWTVDEVLLVESVVGQTRHIEHGRWRLC
jgi:RNA 2',3'-cyclic 3'-phosphodiesterase